MSASLHGLGRFMKRWGSTIIIVTIGTTFVTSLVVGIIEGNKTAYQINVSDQTLDQRIAALPTDGSPQRFPVDGIAEIPVGWDLVCYVGEDVWVSKALRKALNNPLDGYKFEPQDIYGVEDYWVLSFVDIETKTVHSTDINRTVVQTIKGPQCVDGDSARLTAMRDPGISERVDLTFVGSPAKLE
jgi:hypothetical protein